MKVRFVRSWRRYRADHRCELPDGMANVLIRRGIAAEVRRGRPPAKQGYNRGLVHTRKRTSR